MSMGIGAANLGITVAASSKASSVGLQVSTVQSKVDSVGIQTSTVDSRAASVGIQGSTVVSKTDSVGVQGSNIVSKVDSVGVQVGAISLLSNEQVAWSFLKRFSMHPLRETFDGYENADSTFVASSSADLFFDDQKSRYPGAGAWTYRNATTPTLSIGSNSKYFQQSLGGAGTNGGIAGAWPIFITGAQATTWQVEDERIIFETLVTIDSSNNNGDTFLTFIGLVRSSGACTIEGDLTTLSTVPGTFNDTTYTRVGFVTTNAAEKKMYGMVSSGAATSQTSAFSVTYNQPQHLKFVYDVGTGVEFFLNGVSQGTISTNLPVSSALTSTPTVFFPLFHIHNVSAAPTQRIFGVNCYIQNGA